MKSIAWIPAKKDCFVVVCIVLWSLCNAPCEWETSVGAWVGHRLVLMFDSTQKHIHHMELTKSEHECHITKHAYCHLNDHLLFDSWNIWCSLCFDKLWWLILHQRRWSDEASSLCFNITAALQSGTPVIDVAEVQHGQTNQWPGGSSVV